jgi:hypothetical protein
MDSYGGYCWYLALKLHFTSDKYDIIASGANVNVTREQFEKKGLRFAVKKLVKKYDEGEFIQYVIANLLAGDKNAGLFGTEGEDRLREFQKRLQSISYLYEQDLLKLKGVNVGVGMSSIWTSLDGQHPILVKEYLAGNVMLETLVILDTLFGYREQLDQQLSFDPVWKQVSKLIKKYKPFITIKQPKFLAITERVFA